MTKLQILFAALYLAIMLVRTAMRGKPLENVWYLPILFATACLVLVPSGEGGAMKALIAVAGCCLMIEFISGRRLRYRRD